VQHIIQKLKTTSCGKLPGLQIQMQMAPPVRNRLQIPKSDVRIAAVAILIYPKNNAPHILLMQRTQTDGVHSGQISLPGGSVDATDFSITYTAMRELQEEMGVDLNAIRIIGNLTPLYIPPSNFMVTPVVCYSMQALQFNKNESEVSAVIELPLQQLFDPNFKQIETVSRSDDNTKSMQVPIYNMSENIKIWGATAMILRELEELLC
jgi:8-oxo-dGTP pyrophosphatase MutT (NUDIX family)